MVICTSYRCVEAGAEMSRQCMQAAFVRLHIDSQ